MAPPLPPALATLTVDSALSRLRDAEDDHNAVRRTFRSGTTATALNADLARWELLGEAFAGLAVAIARHCADSHFCDARPDVLLLAARLSESIDDLMDEPAWSVTDAAARLAAVDRR